LFKAAARNGLAQRLAVKHGFHPALATVLAVACYPDSKFELPVPAVLSPRDACDAVRRWESLGWEPERLVQRLFGEGSLPSLQSYVNSVEAIAKLRGGVG
jgi:hypothetical protein